MAGQGQNPIQCSEFDALLSQAIDGTLAGERLAAFETHSRVCRVCGPLLQEAEAGRSWLKSLPQIEPPEHLLTQILLGTSGVAPAEGHRGQQISWLGRIRGWGEAAISPFAAIARQPRFAMSFGMAFFTLSVTLSLAGVRLGDLRHVDLRPSAIRRTYYETTGRVVKYYETIRIVYEIESRVRQFKEATVPAEPPPERQDNNKEKENRNDRSGQPEQRQERNYSQEGNQPVLASLTDDPPVVSGATCRRFV